MCSLVYSDQNPTLLSLHRLPLEEIDEYRSESLSPPYVPPSRTFSLGSISCRDLIFPSCLCGCDGTTIVISDLWPPRLGSRITSHVVASLPVVASPHVVASSSSICWSCVKLLLLPKDSGTLGSLANGREL
ncbi:hypothetical protein V6N13_104278 [Hibiscus sabdariffa]|uniref:Uncharacterized protein n=2 Tax=Hibiscus sabdariffa TaxID=183260 RepID=A0ABR1ZIY4_9ROSI